MIMDAIAYTRHYYICQVHTNFIHQPPEYLHTFIASWPFKAKGMDVVGPITPLSHREHRFILEISDYFSKWAEIVPMREVKTANMVKFIKHHVIYFLCVPRWIIHDNESHFANQGFMWFYNKFKIQDVASTPYNPAVNSLADNRTIAKEYIDI